MSGFMNLQRSLRAHGAGMNAPRARGVGAFIQVAFQQADFTEC